MNVTSKGRYALRIMIDLAQHSEDGYISLKTVSDRLGLSMPTTTEEFYQVLKAFKEQDANGNGDQGARRAAISSTVRLPTTPSARSSAVLRTTSLPSPASRRVRSTATAPAPA